MAQRPSPQMAASNAIRQEIQRFESVHPSIYAIYDFIEAITDPILQQQIREHVVCIEDSFVNSQEWTISRAVPDIRLGVLGTVNSGKSALVHRYLTGTYMQEESPEGGRFKKEVSVDGQSYLLLIRDEGGPPEIQFTHWVDAVVLVFSLENEPSFHAVYNYYAKMAHYRNTAEIPVILVGTQDLISESNPRVIDDTRARKLATDLRKCSYYETCATYGLNVDKVFHDACTKVVTSRAQAFSAIVHQQLSPKVSPTPHQTSLHPSTGHPSVSGGHPSVPGGHPSVPGGHPSGQTSVQSPYGSSQYAPTKLYDTPQPGGGRVVGSSIHSSAALQAPSPYRDPSSVVVTSTFKEPVIPRVKKRSDEQTDRTSAEGLQQTNGRRQPTTPQRGSTVQKSNSFSDVPVEAQTSQRPLNYLGELQSRLREGSGSSGALNVARSPRNRLSLLGDKGDGKEILPTPTSTPTQSRKNRRRSNLFTPNKKDEQKRDGEVGSGRSIPLKQGHLYKKSSKGLNREWKKKYVSLTSDGRLTYYPSLHDYMDDVHGKEVKLSHTTVKVPGQARPRGPRSLSSSGGADRNSSNGLDGGSPAPDDTLSSSGVVLNGFSSGTFTSPAATRSDTPSVKKRHRRAKSSTGKNLDINGDDSDGYEFLIVSLDNKQWHFEATSTDERECWVSAIEQQILTSLQGNLSAKSSELPSPARTDLAASVNAIRAVSGNDKCADCAASKPDWASLNLGALICIECSGIHRNLGTHISRVRSLDLDDWPPEYTAVMTSIGNQVTNSVWEANLGREVKPKPNTHRDDKERWIRAKYEKRRFLSTSGDVTKQLIDAIAAGNTSLVLAALAASTPQQVNTAYPGSEGRAAVHIAAALGNVVYLQLLMWYQADSTLCDAAGRTPLHYVRSAGGTSVGACLQLLQTSAAQARPAAPQSTGTLTRRHQNKS